MKSSTFAGIAATVASVLVCVVVLSTDNGRAVQEGVVVELIAFFMFTYAGVKGSRWWFTVPVTVVLFWIIAAHIDSLWK